MWDKLNKYIKQEGGWIVSQPDVSPVRFECPMESELPALLKEAGHRVIPFGTHERLMPVTETMAEHGRTNKIDRQQVGVGIVRVWQFDLR
jgi:hypothetical protein